MVTDSGFFLCQIYDMRILGEASTPTSLNSPAALTAPSSRRRRRLDGEAGAGHEAGVVGGQEDDTVGDVGGGAEAADRMGGTRLFAWTFGVRVCF